MSEVKEKRLPELNDDFAKEVGDGAQTVDELKKKVREQLERAASSKADNEEREAWREVFEQTLLTLSDAIGDRYFLQGAKATPTKKFGGLA